MNGLANHRDADRSVNMWSVRVDQHEHVVHRRERKTEIVEAPDASSDDRASEATMFRENTQHDGTSVQERSSCLSSGLLFWNFL